MNINILTIARACKTFLLILFLFSLLTGCQITPNRGIIVDKTDGIDELIRQTAEQSTTLPNTEKYPTSVEFAKEYESGHKLIVNAPIININSEKIPIISLEENSFQSGTPLKNIVAMFCPNWNVYDRGSLLSKSEIEMEIISLKQALMRVENMLHPITGLPVNSEDEMPSYELPEEYKGDPDAAASLSLADILNAKIREYELLYQKAPDYSDLDLTAYEMKDLGSSFQLNLRAVNSRRLVTFDFVNWDVGSSFYMRDKEYTDEKYDFMFEIPTAFDSDVEFEKERESIDQFVKMLGVDYMTLTSVSKGNGCYIYYYVRSMDGLHETLADTFYGSVPIDQDGTIVMNLWRAERLDIYTKNGSIVRADWKNPSKINKIDNSNVKIIDWESAYNIFSEQMDLMLTPVPMTIPDENIGTFFMEPTTIFINRIELGLTKVLVQNSNGEYKLIPTWSFLGYDENRSGDAKQGSPICFVTVNALDGSIINRGAMY